MNVGEAARRTGLPAKTLRYYEDIDLVRPGRAPNGYRDYSPADVERLRFIAKARSLGFPIEDCRQLVALNEDGSRASHDVRDLAVAQISGIDGKIAELQAMRAALSAMIGACHGDDRPECAILDGMAGKAA